MWSRRDFLKTAASGLSVLLAPSLGLRARSARAAGTDRVLVRIFLGGGADFLNLVAPVGDPNYRILRPTLGLAPGTEVPLDGFFALHPLLAPLQPWYQSGQLAVIHAAGNLSSTRSHFDEADFMERGVAGDKSVQTGWLNRYLVAAGLSAPMAAITFGGRVAKGLRGEADTISTPSIRDLGIVGYYPNQRRAAIEQIFAAAGGPLAQTVENAFSVSDTVRGVDLNTAVSYPGHPFASALKEAAALIKADIGVRVVAADLGGWDHHVDEHTKLPGLVSALGSSLHAFATDLGTHLGRTSVVVMTEFGRRAAENLSRGTDHGWASAMLVLGGGVTGGRVLLRDDVWPGLTPPQLFESMDLRVTTDVRDIFSELLDRHMGLGNLSGVFPGFAPSTARYPGLFV